MKRLTAIMAALSLLLAGCGAAQPEQTANPPQTAVMEETRAQTGETVETAQPVAGSYDLFEEDPVDDSFTFTWHRGDGEKDIQRYVSEDLLPEYLDTWFEDGKILEDATQWTLADGVAGWILIAGTPRQELGWNTLEREGQTLYCRNILVQHIPHSPEYQFLQTTPSPGLHTPDPVEELDHEFFGIEEQGLALPPIRSAELYVKELSQCFRIEEPGKLEILRKGLSLPPQVRMQTFMAGLEPEGVGDMLVLDLEGQGMRMVLTEPEGGPGCDIWSGHLLLMPESPYELFGVPLASKGYGPMEEDGRTLSIERIREGIPYPLRYEYRLDARGNLKSFQDLTEHLDADPAGEPLTDSYTYDQEDRLLSHRTDRGERSDENTYLYNEEGLLTDEFRHMGDEGQEHLHYTYDDQGRILSRVYLDAQGLELPGSGVYFWYDDQGERHGFWYQENGEAKGDPPDTPLRRPK